MTPEETMESAQPTQSPGSTESTGPPDAAGGQANGGTFTSSELARKGGIAVSLLVLVVAIFFAFGSVNEIIATWLEPRWVPVWRAAFAVAVAGLAVYVLQRLTE